MSDEELRSVGIWPAIGHAQHPNTRVLQLKVLVRESPSINALAAAPISPRKVSPLQHEVGNDSMERRALVANLFADFNDAIAAFAKLFEVEDSLGHGFAIEAHLDAPKGIHLLHGGAAGREALLLANVEVHDGCHFVLQ